MSSKHERNHTKHMIGNNYVRPSRVTATSVRHNSIRPYQDIAQYPIWKKALYKAEIYIGHFS